MHSEKSRVLVCACVCTQTKREKEQRNNTNLMLKIKAKSFFGGVSVLCSPVGREVGLVLHKNSVHSMGEMFPRIQTCSTVCCNVFLVTEGQSISISASALQRTALTGLSVFETYDALMTPPRDDKQLKTWLYALDTWHIKLWSKQHVLAWEKAITTLDGHQTQLLIQRLHLP